MKTCQTTLDSDPLRVSHLGIVQKYLKFAGAAACFVSVSVWHINYHKVAKINHKLNKIKFIYRQDNERTHMRLSRAAGLGCFLSKGEKL